MLVIFWILCISNAGSPLKNLIQGSLPPHCDVFNATFLTMDFVVVTQKQYQFARRRLFARSHSISAASHRQRKSAPRTTSSLCIVDLDESYIHHHYCHHNDSFFNPNDPDCSQPHTQKRGKHLCFVAAIRKSKPLMCQARTTSFNDKASLVPNSVWIFQSQQSSGDYHQNVNGANFVRWFKTQLLPNLSEPCLIRLDNARYHRTKPATTLSACKLKKAQLQEVLTASGIQFGAKDMLLLFVKD